MLAILKNLFQYVGKTLFASISVFIALGIVGYLIARLLGINLTPYFIGSGRVVSSGRVIDFKEAFAVDNNIRVCDVQRHDTDGDGFSEWIVIYQVDKNAPDDPKNPCPGNAPVNVAIYDNDRGSPPIIFPYKLQPPDRDYLGETANLQISYEEIIPNINQNTTNPIPEIIIKGGGNTTYLTIFQYQQNNIASTSPTEYPPRYKVIGSFNGTGGVNYNRDSKRVTVIDRRYFERSQLAVKIGYALHGSGIDQTYMANTDSAALSAPVSASIDFGTAPPSDIQDTIFPEKILLAFYQTLTDSAQQAWKLEDFVAAGSEVEQAIKNDNYAYFGFRGKGKPTNLTVTQLNYFPAIEKNCSDTTIEGVTLRCARVEIGGSAKQAGGQQETGLITYQLVMEAGQWKLDKKIN